MVLQKMLEAEFSERYIADPNSGCWLWVGGIQTKGYGSFKRMGESLAHRVAYRLYVGEIPHGLVIDHKCKTRLCVNPLHLEAVTNEENLKRGKSSPDATRAYFASITHCPSGHEYSVENTYVGKNASGYHNRLCRTCQRQARVRYKAKIKAGLAPRPYRSKTGASHVV